MKLKTLFVSVLVLAIVSAVVFWSRRPAPAPSKDPRIGQPLVDQTAIEKAAKLRIADQGKSVVLVRRTDGTWRNTSYHDLPADFSKLSGFVGNLTDAKIERLVTSNPERITRLDFKDTKIELLNAADKPLWSATLGKSAESGGRFVRFGEENKAYLANLNAWLDVEPKNWANSELLSLKSDDVAKLEISFAPEAGGTQPKPVTLSRAKKEDAWTAEPTSANQRVKADKVSATLGYLGSLRFTETSDAGDANVAAAKANPRTLRLTTFDGKTYTVTLGRKPEEKKLKAPAAAPDGTTGPGSLGSVADLTKKEGDAGKPDGNPPLAPEFETIPAGPVFVTVTSSDANAPVNTLMQKRAYQISDYIFTGLPQKPDELFEPAPAPAAASAPAAAPADTADKN